MHQKLPLRIMNLKQNTLTAEELQEVTTNDLATVIKAKMKWNKRIKEFREAPT